jgi:hypothetical protein
MFSAHILFRVCCASARRYIPARPVMALDRPGVFLLGARRSGKTSIARVVLCRTPPHDTLFLPASAPGVPRVYTVAAVPKPFQYNVWDWPGGYPWSPTPAAAVAGAGQGAASSSSSPLLAPPPPGLVDVLTFTDAADDPGPSVVFENDMGDGGGLSALEAEGLLIRQRLSEVECLAAARAVVVVVDVTEDPFAPGGAVEAVRDLGQGLRALASAWGAATAGVGGGGAAGRPQASSSSASAASSSPPPLTFPAVHFFLHKVDAVLGGSGAGSGAELRAELVRGLGASLAAELTDAGFAVAGAATGSAGGGGGGAARGAQAGRAGAATPGKATTGAGPGTSASSSASPGLLTTSLPLPPLSVSYHLTSLFDTSVFEALSRVVQRVAPGPSLLPAVEALCNGLGGACGLEKVLLLDATTRLLHAMDATPLQGGLYELVAEALDVAADVAAIYDPVTSLHAAAPGGLQDLLGGGGDDGGGEGGTGMDPVVAEELIRRATFAAAVAPDAGRCSASLVRLSDGTALYAKEVAPYLVAVCVAKEAEEGAAAGAGAAGGGGGRGSTAGSLAGGDTGSMASAAAAAAAENWREAGESDATLPRSALSLPHRALIDHNLRVLARSLGEMMGVAAAAAAGGKG